MQLNLLLLGLTTAAMALPSPPSAGRAGIQRDGLTPRDNNMPAPPIDTADSHRPRDNHVMASPVDNETSTSGV
jgi:hypothetical protein